MALELTGVGLGIALESEDGELIIGQVPISGVPSANLTLLDDLGVGSKAYSDNGLEYRKVLAGTGADKWVEAGSTNDISWREPAVTKDDATYADLTAAETAINDIGTPADIGGYPASSLVDGDRILFTGITGQNKNVFIVTGTPGSGATLVEDANDPTINDVIRIDFGNSAEQVFYYDGMDWVSPDAALLAEIANIRAYIGKPSSGPTLPDYDSEQVVTDGDNLTTAVSKLDAVAMVTGEALAVTGGTPTTLDSLLTGEYLTAEWTVWVRETATGDTERFIVRGFHNGDGTAGTATNVRNDSSRQRLGRVEGIDVDVVLTGTGGTQAMDLVVAATNDVDIRIVRNNYIKV